VEEEAERVARGVEDDPEVLARLEVGQPAARGDGEVSCRA